VSEGKPGRVVLCKGEEEAICMVTLLDTVVVQVLSVPFNFQIYSYIALASSHIDD